jgi:hypothetical protein
MIMGWHEQEILLDYTYSGTMKVTKTKIGNTTAGVCVSLKSHQDGCGVLLIAPNDAITLGKLLQEHGNDPDYLGMIEPEYTKAVSIFIWEIHMSNTAALVRLDFQSLDGPCGYLLMGKEDASTLGTLLEQYGHDWQQKDYPNRAFPKLERYKPRERQLVEGLEKFAKSLERGTELEDFRVTQVTRNDDGTLRRVSNKPQGSDESGFE